MQAERLVHWLADHQVGHHRRRRLRDRAPLGVVRHVLHHRLLAVVGDVHAQGDLVTAGRVYVVHLRLVRLPQARVVGVLVVVQDDLLYSDSRFIQPPRKNFFVYWIPSTSASISALVVYR